MIEDNAHYLNAMMNRPESRSSPWAPGTICKNAWSMSSPIIMLQNSQRLNITQIEEPLSFPMQEILSPTSSI